MYKLVNDKDGSLLNILQTLNGLYRAIPIEPDNKDYQEYLKWVAEGNTPEPADQ